MFPWYYERMCSGVRIIIFLHVTKKVVSYIVTVMFVLVVQSGFCKHGLELHCEYTNMALTLLNEHVDKFIQNKAMLIIIIIF